MAEIKHQRPFLTPPTGCLASLGQGQAPSQVQNPTRNPLFFEGDLIQEKSLDPSFLIHCSVSHLLWDLSQVSLQLTFVTCSAHGHLRREHSGIPCGRMESPARTACGSLNPHSGPVAGVEASDTTNFEFPQFVILNLLEFLLK